MPLGRRSNVWVWLQADLQPPEIDFCSTPNKRHSEAHAGLPLLTRLGHWGLDQQTSLNRKSLVSARA